MKSIRKVLSFLLALLMVMSLGAPAFAEETPAITLTVDKTDVAVGDTVTVTVGSTGISNVFGMGFKVHADQAVYEVESIETSWTSNNQLAAKGWIKIATFSSTGNNLNPPDTIAVIKLKAKAAAETSSISLSSLEVTKTGADGNSVETVTVTSPEAITTVVKESVIATPGYCFATSADVTADNGGTAVVHVKITGHSDPNVTTYNAYDLTLTYDNTKLEFVSGVGADQGDQIKIEKKGENQIQIVGVGDAKTFDVEVAKLTFKTLAEGAANVTIDKVQVSEKKEAVNEDIPAATPQHKADAPEADETPNVSVIVVPYTVSKPGFISGNDKILHGENYTFSYTDTINYTYSGLKVTVGGTEVTPAEVDGVYTIANVTGAVVIESTQTPNSYDVTKPTNVTFNGPDKATYGTDYVFTVTPGTDMAIDTVTVVTASGVDVPYTINENGEYVIAGTNISGPFTITVTQKDKMTTITFTGVKETEVEGGLTQSAEIGKDFNFKLNKEAAYNYTVMVGETELIESTVTPGQYTIPASLVVQGGVTVNITKADSSKVVVDVHEYINLDGKAMFLVTAKWRDKVLSYGEGNTMFWSSKYTVTGYEDPGAYCWLVVSTDALNTKDAVKTAAAAAIVEAAAGTTATPIGYDYDINETTKVDINDAQLAYDMYNASYMAFTENLPMLKFLEADVSTNMKLDVNDVAAVINFIVNGAAN